ncbi:hypothetical protein NM688_g6549 [Phlebia brevispora]|uniref:Uncharacterized protein n=1 Tax=Phlebia brevispora TaxID=194682 RepID=A0ACC1SEX6_9APHY|nr:hypothetical protein NM688_g6549 [Phlebia brevispora]
MLAAADCMAQERWWKMWIAFFERTNMLREVEEKPETHAQPGVRPCGAYYQQLQTFPPFLPYVAVSLSTTPTLSSLSNRRD